MGFAFLDPPPPPPPRSTPIGRETFSLLAKSMNCWVIIMDEFEAYPEQKAVQDFRTNDPQAHRQIAVHSIICIFILFKRDSLFFAFVENAAGEYKIWQHFRFEFLEHILAKETHRFFLDIVLERFCLVSKIEDRALFKERTSNFFLVTLSLQKDSANSSWKLIFTPWRMFFSHNSCNSSQVREGSLLLILEPIMTFDSS